MNPEEIKGLSEAERDAMRVKKAPFLRLDEKTPTETLFEIPAMCIPTVVMVIDAENNEIRFEPAPDNAAIPDDTEAVRRIRVAGTVTGEAVAAVLDEAASMIVGSRVRVIPATPGTLKDSAADIADIAKRSIGAGSKLAPGTTVSILTIRGLAEKARTLGESFIPIAPESAVEDCLRNCQWEHETTISEHVLADFLVDPSGAKARLAIEQEQARAAESLADSLRTAFPWKIAESIRVRYDQNEDGGYPPEQMYVEFTDGSMQHADRGLCPAAWDAIVSIGNHQQDSKGCTFEQQRRNCEADSIHVTFSPAFGKITVSATKQKEKVAKTPCKKGFAEMTEAGVFSDDARAAFREAAGDGMRFTAKFEAWRGENKWTLRTTSAPSESAFERESPANNPQVAALYALAEAVSPTAQRTSKDGPIRLSLAVDFSTGKVEAVTFSSIFTDEIMATETFSARAPLQQHQGMKV